MIDFPSPHQTAEVICVKCGKRWIAVYPSGTILKDLQCPKCKRQGYVILTGQEFDTDR